METSTTETEKKTKKMALVYFKNEMDPNIMACLRMTKNVGMDWLVIRTVKSMRGNSWIIRGMGLAHLAGKTEQFIMVSFSKIRCMGKEC